MDHVGRVQFDFGHFLGLQEMAKVGAGRLSVTDSRDVKTPELIPG